MLEVHEFKKVPRNCSTCLYGGGIGCGNANVGKDYLSDQKHNGRYAVVYKSERWTSPFIDICGTPYNTEQAVERMREISREAAEAALKEREDDPCKS